MNVPFFRIDCSGRELDYLTEVLRSGWLTTSRFAAELEDRFSDAVGGGHALAVSSCTAALHLALEAIGVGPGTRVLVPTLTFTATAEVVHYLGAQIVLCDVDPGTGLMTPEILERSLEADPGIGVVVPVHFAGLPCDIDGLLRVADPRGVRIVEDAAHAFPAAYRTADGTSVPVGTARTAACCFSFYANKTMTSGEGGMLVTNDDSVADRARTMRLHGIDRDIWKRFTTTPAKWQYDVVAPGFKYNMSDLHAAVGLAQFERVREFHEARIRMAERYLAALSPLDNLIELPVAPKDLHDHAWHLFAIVIRADSGIDRDLAIDQLAASGVGTSVHYRPLHRMTHWQRQTGANPDWFPGAEHRWRGTVSLPLFPAMRTDEHDFVCESLHRVLANAVPVG
jgi:dTDP-4-amino-4,6-dideoxygalactose transaminase